MRLLLCAAIAFTGCGDGLAFDLDGGIDAGPDAITGVPIAFDASTLEADAIAPGAAFPCHPLVQNPCPDGAGGASRACYIQGAGSQCWATFGSGVPVGMSCRFVNDCVGGAGCYDVGDGLRCFRYCDYQHYAQRTDPRCGGDELCAPLFGQNMFGVCAP